MNKLSHSKLLIYEYGNSTIIITHFICTILMLIYAITNQTYIYEIDCIFKILICFPLISLIFRGILDYKDDIKVNKFLRQNYTQISTILKENNTKAVISNFELYHIENYDIENKYTYVFYIFLKKTCTLMFVNTSEENFYSFEKKSILFSLLKYIILPDIVILTTYSICFSPNKSSATILYTTIICGFNLISKLIFDFLKLDVNLWTLNPKE